MNDTAYARLDAWIDAHFDEETRFLQALVQVPTLPFFLASIALRQYLTGRAIMAPAMWVAWLANGLNVVANWALIFGHLGFAPRVALRKCRCLRLDLHQSVNIGGRPAADHLVQRVLIDRYADLAFQVGNVLSENVV